MAKRQTTLLLKKSGVPGKIPTELQLGELAINFSDVILYASGTSTNSILPIGWDRVSKTGDTMSGTLYTPSISATTISATTYYGLPSIFGGDYLPLSGGTVYGTTNFTNGLNSDILNVSGLTQTSGITSTGGITFKQVTINSSYTATTSDYMIDVTGGTFTVSLPSAVGIQGRLLVIKNNGGGAVTVQPILGQNIDGKPFVILGETNTIQLSSNGSEWVAISYNISTVNSSTGVFAFTGLTIASPTTFTVSPIKGWIVDDTTNPLSPQLYYVDYSGGTHTATYVTTSTETWVYLTSGGTISQSNIELTEQQRRQNIFLGKLGHANKTNIINVFSQPDFVLSPLSQLRDMFAPINLINGGVYASPNGVNLSFNTSAGYLYGLGINFASSTLNPNSIYVSGNSPTTFQYRTQTGGTTSNTTLIDPTKYDVGGVVTSISGTKATNQRIYLVQNGIFRVQYGQTEYQQLTAAIEGIATEQFNTFSNFTNNGILIGVLSVLSTATDLSDTSKARFFFTSKFGETVGAAGGISTTTLQQAYNNSTNPEIITNSTLNAFQIRGGTGSDLDANFIIENNSGEVKGRWLGNGGLTATTMSATSITINSTTSTDDLLNVYSTGGTKSLTVDKNGFVYNSGSGNIATNTIFGLNALAVNISGNSNTAIGVNTLRFNTTNDNTAVGTNVLTNNTTGTTNTGIGKDTLFQNTIGVGNSSLGYRALFLNTTGSSNTAIGLNTLYNNRNINNTAVGANALYENVNGDANVAIGVNTLRSSTGGTDSVAIGVNALFLNVTGSTNTAVGVGSQQNSLVVDNTSIGYRSLYLNTVGLQNTALGTSSVRSNTTGSFNTGVGYGALQLNTTGNHNIGLGRLGGYGNTTGTGNISIGSNTMFTSSSGSSNIAIGYQSMFSNVSGSNNVNVGYETAFFLTGGSSNVNVGFRSGYRNITGITTVAIGQEALFNNLVSSNVGVGYRSLYTNTIGTNNTANGYQTLYLNIIGSNNTANGYQSLYSNTSGSSNTADGHQSMFSNTSGDFNVGIGSFSLYSNISGYSNTSIGYASLFANTTGYENVGVGLNSLRFNKIGFKNVALGTSALYSNVSGKYNTAIGDSAGWSNDTGDNNTAIGFNALYSNTSGFTNIAVGLEALRYNTTGSNNVAIGGGASNTNTIGSFNVAIGHQSQYFNLSGSNLTSIGYRSLRSNTTGVSNTALGSDSLINNTTGSNNTATGFNTLFNNTTGSNNTANGYQSLQNNTIGSNNTALGKSALNNNISGTTNTAIGSESLQKNTIGSNNVSLGYRSLYENLSGSSNTSIGFGSSLTNTTGNYNTSVGNTSFYFNTTGSYNTTLGNESMYNNTTGLANVAIGSNALFNNTTGSYNTVIGYNTALGITSGSNNTIIGSRVSGLSGLSNSLVLADGNGVVKLSADSSHHLFIPNSPSSGSTSDRILTRSTSGEIREIDTTTVVLKTKSGVVAFTSFTGSPYTYDVVFVTPFTDALYSPQIIGYDSRSWTISNVTLSGFRIETNSTTILTNNVYWTVTKHGEN